MHMKRVQVAAFVLLLIMVGPACGSGHKPESKDAEVASVLEAFLKSSRSYSMEGLLETLHREIVEEELLRIFRITDPDVRERAIRLLFNNYFIFAGSCDATIEHVSEIGGVVSADVAFNHESGLDAYEFNFERENELLRLMSISLIESRQRSIDGQAINVCDEPIDWLNPAIRMPGESASQQSDRLGIP